MAYFNSNKVKQIAALGGILALSGFLFVTLCGFIPAFLGAVIFYVICSPFVLYLINKKKWKRGLAVSIVMILSFLIILIPVFSLSYLLVSKVTVLLAESQGFYSQVENFNSYIHANLGINILTAENLSKFQNQAANFIPSLFGQTLSIMGDIAIMYFVLFYLLMMETEIEKSIVRFLPYQKDNAHLFAKELVSQTYSNVIGAPLLAFVQAIFAIFGFWIFGLNDPLFWGLMCGFLSFVPLLGSALIWIPAGIIQLNSGAHWQGAAILIYGILIISNVDNIFRFIIQKKIADVHPIVTVFGVIIGLQWFGLPGIIFGPLLISYLMIMIDIYRTEYSDKNYISTAISGKDDAPANPPESFDL